MIFASHEQNQPLADTLNTLAAEHGLETLHNRTSIGHFDGYHRYLVGLPGVLSIRSKTCLRFAESRFIRHMKPSQRGEKASLEQLLAWLAEYRPGMAIDWHDRKLVAKTPK